MPKPKKNEYVVKAGDSYAKIAEQLYGDQRGFGDLARINKYRNLRPGDVIQFGPKRKDFFVSSQDVAFANQSNPTGPQMQQSDEYQANYKAATAAGFAGVNQAQAAGVQQSGQVQGSGIDWAAKKPESVPLSQAGPSYAGQAGAQAWMAQDQKNKDAAAIAKGAALEAGNGMGALPGSVAAGAPTPIQPATGPGGGRGVAGANPSYGTSGANNTPGAGGRSRAVPTGGKTAQQPLGPQSQIAADQFAAAQAANTSAQAAAVQQQKDIATAQNALQAISTNQNVPTFISKGAVPYIMDVISQNPDAQIAFEQAYTWDNDGNLVPKGTTMLPGMQNDPNFFTSSFTTGFTPDTYDVKYSNVPPRGYDDRGNVYTQTGRGAGGNSGADPVPAAMREQDFNINIGQ